MAALVQKQKLKSIRHHFFIIILSIVIGALAGFGAYGVSKLIGLIQSVSWKGVTDFLEIKQYVSPLYILLIPALGGLLVGPIIFKGAREAKGHGVPEVMESVFLKGGVIRKRVAFIKALASSITIGTGGPVGREGPIVQIGSSIASSIGQIFQIKENELKVLVGAGAAAGISAAFNAPIAGALFATEIILGNFAITSFAPIIVASVMGNLVFISIEGSKPIFSVPVYSLNSGWELIFYLILGIVCGIVGILFIKILYYCEKKWLDLKLNEMIKPFFGGIIIGAIAIFYPHIMGSGYTAIDLALKGNLVLWTALLLILIKIFATSTSLSSGGSGGIFAPSLFMGAYAGFIVGSLFNYLFPSLGITPGAYALVGMGGVVSSAIHGPLTAIIIIFELTGDYNIILPLMITCIIASLLSEVFNEYSIYTLKLKLKGILFKQGVEVNILKRIKVSEIIKSDFAVVNKNAPLKKLIGKVMEKNINIFHVVDEADKHIGIITLSNLKIAIGEKDIFEGFLLVEDIYEPIEAISEQDSLEKAMTVFGRNDVNELPVLKNGELIGVVKRTDLIETYNQEIKSIEAKSSFLAKIKFSENTEIKKISDEYFLKDLSAPSFCWGKTLKELNLRTEYGVELLNVKQKSPFVTIPLPYGNFKIKKGDTLMVAGSLESIKNFEE
jgi:CIC family chloride channel protein